MSQIKGLSFTLCILAMLCQSALAAGDPETKAEANCYSDLTAYQMHSSISRADSNSCVPKDSSSLVAVLKVRYTKRGIYIFDKNTGSARFFELKTAPGYPYGKDVAGSLYSLKTGPGNRQISVVYKDTAAAFYPFGLDQKSVDQIQHTNFPVSEAEFNEFVTRKAIPKDLINSDLRDRTIELLRFAKKEARLRERDPQSNHSGKLADLEPSESLVCDPNYALFDNIALDLAPPSLSPEPVSDQPAKDALKQSLMALIKDLQLEKAGPDAPELVKKADLSCAKITDTQLSTSLTPLRDAVGRLGAQGETKSAHDSNSAPADSEKF